jgi:hypothetical protein
MKNKLSIATLVAALLLAILWAAHQFNFIGFVKHLHGG